MKVYYDKDCNLAVLKKKKVAIIGYGSQGHAHALNLNDAGFDVVVGLKKESASVKKAEAAGLKVVTVAEASKVADILMILMPDEVQGDVYREEIAPYLKKVPSWPSAMASIYILTRLYRVKTLTYSWWLQKGRVIWFVTSSFMAAACLAW